MDREGTVRLLAAILADSPRLPGAACVGRHELFDPIRRTGDPRYHREEQLRRTEAARLCSGCAALARCPCPTVPTTAVEAAIPPPRRSA